MHRRQYIPGSQNKISRAEQVAINRNLRDELIRREETEARRIDDARKAARARETTGIRGFINKVKKFMNRPLFASKRTC